MSNVLKKLFIKRALRKNQSRRQFVSFAEANTFLLGYYYDQPAEEIKEIQLFASEIKKSGKEINLLVFHRTPKLPETIYQGINEQHFTKSDLGITGLPKTDHLKSFLRRDYDYYIDCSMEPNSFFIAIAAFTKARFRIGRYYEDLLPYFELMIDPKSSSEACEDFLKEVGKHLKTLQNAI